MGWLLRTVNSSIGGKSIVAVTGLGLVGFLIAHLSGNLLVFSGPEVFAQYAEGLHSLGPVLWGLRAGLLATFILHVAFAIRLNRQSKAARPVAYACDKTVTATFVSRHMVHSGLLLLVFIMYHLAHYTFRVTDPEISQLGQFRVYEMVVIGFQNPLMSGLYIFAMVVLGMHLSHGITSFFQTLGLNHVKYNLLIRRLGPALGILFAALYSSIPLAVWTGLLK